MKYGKIDKKQPAIVSELRQLGFSVFITSRLSEFVDAVLGKEGINILIEIKENEKKKLTPAQVKLHSEWRGQISVITCAEDVLKIFERLKAKAA